MNKPPRWGKPLHTAENVKEVYRQRLTEPIAFSKLCELLGPPEETADGDKISTEWVLADDLGDFMVAIHDWKETNLYEMDLPSVEEFRASTEENGYDWTVSARTPEHADKFLVWLKEALKQPRDPYKCKVCGQEVHVASKVENGWIYMAAGCACRKTDFKQVMPVLKEQKP